MTTRRLDHSQRSFGRRRPFVGEAVAAPAPIAISDDLKLFALTYLAGFAFVFIYLA